VGVAAIFDAVGKTVRTGKRVHQFNEYAGLIERRLRDDIAAMTRDGYLIIRNGYADANGDGQITIPAQIGGTSVDDVLLYDGDEHPRLRRTDEIMFFAKGQFMSVRELLDPRFVARSDAAAIYYGHGMRARDPGFNAGGNPGSYYEPSVGGNVNGGTLPNPDTEATLGHKAQSGPVNPNEFASEWILLRHVTLLRPPAERLHPQRHAGARIHRPDGVGGRAG
jgi:hypothetical protein